MGLRAAKGKMQRCMTSVMGSCAVRDPAPIGERRGRKEAMDQVNKVATR